MAGGWHSLVAPAMLAVATGILFFAAIHDITTRTVPNWVAVLLALTGLGARIMGNDLSTSLIIAGAISVLAAICWRRGWLGGADVKLIAATSLAVAPNRVPVFIVAMTVSGSILALLYLAAGRIVRRLHPANIARRRSESLVRSPNLVRRAARAEFWRLRRGGPLPYACAIFAGFIFVMFR